MKKLRLLVICILCIPIYVIGQLQGQERIDSLLTQLTKLEDGIPKIKTLEHLYYAEVYNNPKKGLEYARKSLDLSSRLKNWSGFGVANYHIGVYFKLRSVQDSAMYYYKKALAVWEEHPDKKLHAVTLSSIASLEWEMGDVDKAITTQKEVNKINKENGFWLNYGIGLGLVGDMYSNKGNYKIGYEMSIDALRVLDTVPEEPWRDADMLKQIGNIEMYRGNYKQALGHYEKALEVYLETNDIVYQGHTYIALGNAFHELKQYDKAISYYQKSLVIGEEIDAKDIQGNSLANLGMSHNKKELYADAIQYLEKALKINRVNNSVANLISSLTEIGNTYRGLRKFEEAELALNEAITLADSIDALDQKKIVYGYRSQLFRDTKEYMKAIQDIDTYQKLNDSIFNRDSSRQIEELKTIYETEKKEAALALQEEEIKTLNEKAKVDKLTKGLYAGGMGSALALSGLLVFGFRQRMKKNRIAREKQEEIYKQEIEHKQKELASQTLHLVQKNTFIQELKENLENIKNSPEKFKMEFRRIVMLLKRQNASDKDWEVFKSYFSEVHNDFDQKLKTLYADISEKEIRLAAFLRMNLTTKEIAATLNVLPDSILKSKYRLKKKLGLDKEMDLTSFLNAL